MLILLKDKAKLCRAHVLATLLDCTVAQARMARHGMIMEIDELTPELARIADPVLDPVDQAPPVEGSPIADQEETTDGE